MAGVDVDSRFWSSRRVFLTGHTGFKGGWLSLWLKEMGAEVFGFALDPPTSPSLFERADVKSALTDTRGDVRDLESVKRALAAARPEIVLHLAAQPLVRQSYEDPVGTYSTNVLGTVHVLEAVRLHIPSAIEPPLAAVLVVTSDKAYENQEWPWSYRENDALGGHDPYSNSKGCAELVASSYRRSFATAGSRPFALATARAGNVIGGGDWAAGRLIPDAVRALAQGEALRIRSPDAVRPWQHVLEPLGGYLQLVQRMMSDAGRFSGPWNFGPEPEAVRTVADVVNRFVSLSGGGAQLEADAGEHPHEAGFLSLDCSKARKEIGWRPRLSLDYAIRLTADWYRANSRASGRSMHDYTIGQIRDFVRLGAEPWKAEAAR